MVLIHSTLVLPNASRLWIVLRIFFRHNRATLSRWRSLHSFTLVRRWHSRRRIWIILRLMLTVLWRVLVSRWVLRTANTWLMTSHANWWRHCIHRINITIARWRVAIWISVTWWHHSWSSLWWMHVHTRRWIRILSTTSWHSLWHHTLIAVVWNLLIFGMARRLWSSGRLFFNKTHLMEHLGYLISSLWVILMLSWVNLASHWLRLPLLPTLTTRPGSHWVGVFLLVFLILLYRILHLILIN